MVQPHSSRRRPVLAVVVGVAACAAPAAHAITDAIETASGGFSAFQLWLNYAAFLPMSWLLLGICIVRGAGDRPAALGGAILYGIAFTYFAHTTLAALQADLPTYAELWQREGPLYTVHGGLMIAGGTLFAASAWGGGWLPRLAVLLFSLGLATNLVLAILPAPATLQVIGSLLRNAGLIAMGLAILTRAGQPGDGAPGRMAEA